MTEMLECAYILKCIVCLQSLKGVHRDVGSGISIPAPARSLTVNQCACYIRSVTLQHGVHMTNLELGLSCRDSRHGFTVQLHCHTKKGFLRAVAILMAVNSVKHPIVCTSALSTPSMWSGSRGSRV